MDCKGKWMEIRSLCNVNIRLKLVVTESLTDKKAP